MDEPPAWFTEAQRGTFKVGDRVTVVLSECPRGVRHGEQEHGITGLVIDTDGREKDHPITVWFDRPPWLTRSYLRSSCYAAGELRPFNPLAGLT
jgi:hypothetical protein